MQASCTEGGAWSLEKFLSPVYTRLRQLDPGSVLGQLERLTALRDKGAISPEAFERIRGAPYLEIVDAPLNAAGNAFEDDPDKAPEQYRHMVGVGAYRKTMHELRLLRDKHGFQLIALTGGPGPDYFLQTCRDEGIPVVTGWDAFLAHMKEHGSGSFVESDIVLSKTDIHPSPIGHRLHADVLFRYMKESGLAEQLVRQAQQR